MKIITIIIYCIHFLSDVHADLRRNTFSIRPSDAQLHTQSHLRARWFCINFTSQYQYWLYKPSYHKIYKTSWQPIQLKIQYLLLFFIYDTDFIFSHMRPTESLVLDRPTRGQRSSTVYHYASYLRCEQIMITLSTSKKSSATCIKIK